MRNGQSKMYATFHLLSIALTCLKIVYLSIMGPLMLAAVFEWVLWLAAFLYCLVKVFQKADHSSIRFLAITMIVLFALLR